MKTYDTRMGQVSDHVWDFRPGFHILKHIFNRDTCGSIIELAESRHATTAEITTPNGTYRQSDIFWLKPGDAEVDKLFETLKNRVLPFNDETYRFDIDDCMDLQLTRYAVGGHYDWHADLATGVNSRRKLSMSVMLSQERTFEGGDLAFFANDKTNDIPQISQGDGVVFPSWLKHKVTPVTAGIRWSLVAWFTGPPLR